MKGKILGSRYKIIEYLAEGGFGRTYLAEDTQLPGKDSCVVKQLYPNNSNPQFLDIARRLFKREASTLHNLGHHQQIPELLAYFEEEEKFYLVQQYIQGRTLGNELNSGQIWSQEQVIELLQDGLNILQFVHNQGVIHRDVKPDNLIRRDSDGKIVLVDFGTVKEVLKGQQTNLGQFTVGVGTQGYMPTEQARGKPRPSSDLYALGMIGIQALTGILPLDLPEDDEGEIIWQPGDGIRKELSAILTRMTRYHFKDRYPSAINALADLDRLLSVVVGLPTKMQSVTVIPTLAVDDSKTHQTSLNSEISPSKVEEIPSIDQPDPTVINSHSARQFPTKSKRKKIISLVVAAIALTLGVGVYAILRQPSSEIEIKSPPKEVEPQPGSGKRVNQGSGFRKDI